MSTAYNVVEDRRDWARVKAGLMTPEDRKFLMEELIRRDEGTAFDIMGRMVAEQHGLRRRARARVAYPR